MSFDATRPHNLKKLPPRLDLYNPQIVDALIKARTAVAELKGYTVRLPNAHLLISPTLLKESVASSSIENINTTISEVFQGELIPESEQSQPDKEVLRYRRAIQAGYSRLARYSISTRLVHEIHKTLLSPDEDGFRRVQNKIENTITHEVLYTPPIASKIPELMNNLESFANGEDSIDPLIKAAILHYQFEAIHPFNDGNGRTGRILMVLYLVKEDLLSLPTLYISGYINDRKNDYYRLLREITANSDWNEYLLFMLEGYYSQALNTKANLVKMMDALENFKNVLKKNHKKIYTSDLAEVLYSTPYVNPTRLSRDLEIHRTTASRYLKDLAEAGILRSISAGKYIFYMNEELLNIINTL